MPQTAALRRLGLIEQYTIRCPVTRKTAPCPAGAEESMLKRLGRTTIHLAVQVNRIFTTLLDVLLVSCSPRTWSRPVRRALVVEIWRCGVESVWFTAFLACLVGVTVTVQVRSFLESVGQANLTIDLLYLLIREAGPLITSLFVVARTAGAMTTELANQKVLGQVNALSAQGIEPLEYLVVPRVVGLGISLLCLGLLFAFVMVASIYLFQVALNPDPLAGTEFINSLLKRIHLSLVLSVVGKTLVPGLLTGTICCIHGLGVEPAIDEVPRASSKAMSQSIFAMFLVSALVSLVLYT
jgi:phospholipid/cholesterol/gamma-HCH transport system permease protein